MSAVRAPGGARGLPGAVWLLGIASLFMDLSSELIHAVLPLFLSGVLGASMATIGLIEGVAEGVASATKLLGGALSDRRGRRKGLLVAGYGLAALAKPIFPLAASAGAVFAARFADRLGKGLRGAPRDALVADLVPPAHRGAAYGLRQALDSAGACLGPLLAVGMLALLAGDLRGTMWAGAALGVAPVLLLIFLLREPAPAVARAAAPPLRLATARALPRRYWLVVALGAVFMLARFSEAFLLLRARDLGLAIGLVPLVLAAMNLVYAAAAYPAGARADRRGARGPLLLGLALLAAADVVFAVAPTPAWAFAGAALWGLHLALTQGLFAKLVADAAPPPLRATAFGIFHLASGLSFLGASTLAGVLWSAYGPAATFGAGAALALVAGVGLAVGVGVGRRPRAAAAA